MNGSASRKTTLRTPSTPSRCTSCNGDGISTGRKVGSAVVRNGVRRRLRTILRAVDPEIQPGYDILFVARPAAADVKQSDLDAAVHQLLRGAAILGTGDTRVEA